MPEPERSPLSRLVLFLVCLSAIAALVASIHYFVIDLPAQKEVPPAPENCIGDECVCPYPPGDYWFDWNLWRCSKPCCYSMFDMKWILTAISGA